MFFYPSKIPRVHPSYPFKTNLLSNIPPTMIFSLPYACLTRFVPKFFRYRRHPPYFVRLSRYLPTVSSPIACITQTFAWIIVVPLPSPYPLKLHELFLFPLTFTSAVCWWHYFPVLVIWHAVVRLPTTLPTPAPPADFLLPGGLLTLVFFRPSEYLPVTSLHHERPVLSISRK